MDRIVKNHQFGVIMPRSTGGVQVKFDHKYSKGIVLKEKKVDQNDGT
jgi:hypothetical protein